MTVFVWTITVLLAVAVFINLRALVHAAHPFALMRREDVAAHAVTLAILMPLFAWGCFVLATAP